MLELIRLVLFLIALVALPVSYSADGVPEPDGYRLDDYDAPVPSTLRNGFVLESDEVGNFLKDNSVIPIDVVPMQRKPQGLNSTTFWMPPPHHGIPGSIWLPDVGRGRISPELDTAFRSVLDEVTKGDASASVMFYCRPDCWMSWNAARRAIEYGYSSVYWFPEGISGWQNWNDETEVLIPYWSAE